MIVQIFRSFSEQREAGRDNVQECGSPAVQDVPFSVTYFRVPPVGKVKGIPPWNLQANRFCESLIECSMCEEM